MVNAAVAPAEVRKAEEGQAGPPLQVGRRVSGRAGRARRYISTHERRRRAVWGRRVKGIGDRGGERERAPPIQPPPSESACTGRDVDSARCPRGGPATDAAPIAWNGPGRTDVPARPCNPRPPGPRGTAPRRGADTGAGSPSSRVEIAIHGPAPAGTTLRRCRDWLPADASRPKYRTGITPPGRANVAAITPFRRDERTPREASMFL